MVTFADSELLALFQEEVDRKERDFFCGVELFAQQESEFDQRL